MAARLDTRVNVDARPEDLFDLMADPENETAWNPDVLEVRRLGQGPLAPGAEWEGRYKGMGWMRTFSRRPAQLAAGVRARRSPAAG